jgi:D-glycero-alpha-D-manno-heptose 1-phosphate guanylyltransferase
MAGNFAEVTGAVLAGGLGTRLRSAVADFPKVLAPVRGRPYISYLLDQLASAGVRETVLMTGYKADQVQSALGDSYASMSLIYSTEPTPLGTAGALRLALPKLSQSTVLVLNGDSYCDVSLRDFLDFHRRQAADLSLVLSQVADTGRFGRVQVSAGVRVLRFEEKQASGDAGWINSGIYLVNRPLIEEIAPDRPASLEREMFPLWAAEKRCCGFRCTGRFLDIGTPESYALADTFFAARRVA